MVTFDQKHQARECSCKQYKHQNSRLNAWRWWTAWPGQVNLWWLPKTVNRLPSFGLIHEDARRAPLVCIEIFALPEILSLQLQKTTGTRLRDRSGYPRSSLDGPRWRFIGQKIPIHYWSGLEKDTVAVNAISFRETSLLLQRGKIELSVSDQDWRWELLHAGIGEIPLNGCIALLASSLNWGCHGPADRFIIATALHHESLLITADKKILGWTSSLKRGDARTWLWKPKKFHTRGNNKDCFFQIRFTYFSDK